MLPDPVERLKIQLRGGFQADFVARENPQPVDDLFRFPRPPLFQWPEREEELQGGIHNGEVHPMAGKLATTFDKAAQWTAKQCGKAHTFVAAIAVVILWGVSGPLFGFSDTWQLVINTGTTIITFLMVFLIQNTQNRDTEALQLKLDELIRVSAEARNRLINLEDLTEDEMDKVKKDLTAAAAKGRADPEERKIRTPDDGQRGRE